MLLLKEPLVLGGQQKLQLTFDPSCDVQEVVLIMLPQVSGAQPALLIQRLLCFVGHVQVAHEDVTTPETDLSVPVRVQIHQLRPAARHHLPTAANQTSNTS